MQHIFYVLFILIFSFTYCIIGMQLQNVQQESISKVSLVREKGKIWYLLSKKFGSTLADYMEPFVSNTLLESCINGNMNSKSVLYKWFFAMLEGILVEYAQKNQFSLSSDKQDIHSLNFNSQNSSEFICAINNILLKGNIKTGEIKGTKQCTRPIVSVHYNPHKIDELVYITDNILKKISVNHMTEVQDTIDLYNVYNLQARDFCIHPRSSNKIVISGLNIVILDTILDKKKYIKRGYCCTYNGTGTCCCVIKWSRKYNYYCMHIYDMKNFNKKSSIHMCTYGRSSSPDGIYANPYDDTEITLLVNENTTDQFYFDPLKQPELTLYDIVYEKRKYTFYNRHKLDFIGKDAAYSPHNKAIIAYAANLVSINVGMYERIKDDSDIYFIDTRCRNMVTMNQKSRITCLAFNPHVSCELASGSGDGSVYIWDMRYLKTACTFLKSPTLTETTSLIDDYQWYSNLSSSQKQEQTEQYKYVREKIMGMIKKRIDNKDGICTLY